MRRFFIITALFLWGAPVAPTQAQNYLPGEGRAPWRTEFISYDIRREADNEITVGSKYFRALDFKAGAGGSFSATLNIPGLWLDRAVFVRDTGRTGRYQLTVNGRRAGYNTDSYGGGEWMITPMLTEGENRFEIHMMGPDTAGSDMERFEGAGAGGRIEGIYLFSQPRIRVHDYTVSGYFDAEFKDYIVDMAVIVESGFNMPEQVQVAYDIWDPAGVRRDFVSVDAEIRGRGCDTVRLRHKVMGVAKNIYSAVNPALYRVVLTLRHNNWPVEYIPLKMGFGRFEWNGGVLRREGEAIKMKTTEELDFPVRAEAAGRLRALKAKGFNTVTLARPQQRWFYDMAAAEGVWVIDRAAVECDPREGDRTVDGGAVANKPEYLQRFLDRQAAMFFRRRNYPNIVGWSVGAPSGNGYNMYKSYQLVRSLDQSRPVVYNGAEGEWNNDAIK